MRGSDIPAFRLAAEIAKTHHEKWDGSGCFHLRQHDIPTPGRLVAVVGAFVELTSHSPSSSDAAEAALREITSHSGEWYDPHIVEVFRTVAEAQFHPGAPCLRLVAQAACRPQSKSLLNS